MNKKFFLNLVKVDINSLNQRIDNFLFKKIKTLSRSKIYSLLRKGNIRVNKKRILPKYKLQFNDIIRIPLVKINENKIYINKERIISFRKYILYEDDYLLVINKPYGISVHGGKNININILDIFRNLISNRNYLELVHRLDKNVSGILILSKNKFTLCKLHDDIKNKKIYKNYIALVCGRWPLNIKIFKSYLCKKNIKKKKYSETHFQILKYVNNFTLLNIKPITGRNHQIRIHTSFLGYPILFDNIYGDKNLNFKIFNKIKINRLFLHSNFIKFYHPVKKKYFSIKSNLDKKLLLILKKIYNLYYKK